MPRTIPLRFHDRKGYGMLLTETNLAMFGYDDIDSEFTCIEQKLWKATTDGLQP